MSVPLAFIGVIAIWSTTPQAIKWDSEGPVAGIYDNHGGVTLTAPLYFITWLVLEGNARHHYLGRRLAPCVP